MNNYNLNEYYFIINFRFKWNKNIVTNWKIF